MEAVRADLFPTFSPDGRRLAFLRGRPSVPERWDLLVQPLSRGTPPQARGDAVVVRGMAPDGIGGIAWLPSGDELVVGGQRIFLDGSPPRPFGHPGRKPTDPSDIATISPVSVRGTKVAFDAPESRFQLVSVPLVGAAKPPFAPFFPSTRGEWDPAFAPDGRKVAFGSWRSGDSHIWIGDADGSACRELPVPPGSTVAGSPSWSPDGRRLAFDAEVGGTPHVYIATPEGGTLRQLTSERTSDARPRWSRDGRFV
jgi:Tol biopolymer transport system component